MEEFGLVQSDYEHFKSRGFEVVKNTSGKFYIRASGAATQQNLIEAKIAAEKCGFFFDMNGYILGYIKSTDNDNSN